MVLAVFRNRMGKHFTKKKVGQSRIGFHPIYFRPRVELLEDRRLPSTVNTWIAIGSSGTWNNPSNWSLGHIPTISEIATFDASSSAVCQIDTPPVGTNMASGINMTAAYGGSIWDNADLIIGADGFVGGNFTVTASTITISGDWTENGAEALPVEQEL
jgi:hypothetical protein